MKKITFNNCSFDNLKEFEGYVIDSVSFVSDEGEEGATVDCHRMIDCVEIGRSFYIKGGECYISREHIDGKH